MTEPVWLRVNPSIRSFILGEVERQYHPIGTHEYKQRVEWMTDAWTWAHDKYKQGQRRPTIEDILFLAARIEPGVNRNGFRAHGVMVGDHTAPPSEWVPTRMERLWLAIEDVVPERGIRTDIRDSFMSADDFYVEFEHIHPFGDGNGRTGKILHNWLLGTLHDPVLVKDYFGGGNP
jgi:hypothetical protein